MRYRRGRLTVRRLVLSALVIIAGCSSPSAPSAAVAGTWAENFSIVGASLIVAVDNAGSGSGTYAIEAGCSGVVQVTGQVAASTLTLTITYDYGAVRTFRSTLTDANHLSGTFDDSAGTVMFTRR